MRGGKQAKMWGEEETGHKGAPFSDHLHQAEGNQEHRLQREGMRRGAGGQREGTAPRSSHRITEYSGLEGTLNDHLAR